jgi:hypothetical protein
MSMVIRAKLEHASPGSARGNALVLLMVGVLSGCPSRTPPCVSSVEDLVVEVGSKTRLRLGELYDNSDCRYDLGEPSGFSWRSPQSRVVELAPDGNARGLKAGRFIATATRGSVTLTVTGHVLPRGWRLRLDPPTANLQVGESVAFRVFPVDESGQKVMDVPFRLTTGPSETPSESALYPGGFSEVVGPQSFRATRPGTAVVTATLGDRSAQATVTVLPSKEKRVP